MPLFTPDRQITPYDPQDEPTEYTRCDVCDSLMEDMLMIKNFMGEKICNHDFCIKSSRLLDIENNLPSEEKRINEYYDKFLNELK